MKSLRAQLMLGAGLGTALVLIVSGVTLYALISRALRREFDAALVARVHSLSVLIEQSEDGLEFEALEAPMPEFSAEQPAEFYQLWTADGAVFARSPSLRGADLDRLDGTIDAAAFGDLVLPNGQAGRVAAVQFIPRREYAHGPPDVSTAVTLAVARPISGLQHTLARIRGVLIGVCFAALIVAAGSLAWVVRQGVRPIAELSRSIAEMDAADLGTRIAANGIPNELSPVIDHLNGLLARLEAAFERERRFTGDVAHELRTPLAALRLRLELSLSRDRQPADYRSALAECLSISLRTQRLVENLLHLARADAGQLDIRTAPVNIAELVEACWSPLQERARARQLHVDLHIDPAICVQTDRNTLQLAIQNMLDNAVTYANENGKCNIALRTNGDAAELTVSNTGSQLSSADLTRVFDRFWRGDPADTPTGDHHGLGLSLCKAVVERLGGSLAASTPSAGVFQITLCIPFDAQSAQRRATTREV